jgi:hypothetical protein
MVKQQLESVLAARQLRGVLRRRCGAPCRAAVIRRGRLRVSRAPGRGRAVGHPSRPSGRRASVSIRVQLGRLCSPVFRRHVYLYSPQIHMSPICRHVCSPVFRRRVCSIGPSTRGTVCPRLRLRPERQRRVAGRPCRSRTRVDTHTHTHRERQRLGHGGPEPEDAVRWSGAAATRSRGPGTRRRCAMVGSGSDSDTGARHLTTPSDPARLPRTRGPGTRRRRAILRARLPRMRRPGAGGRTGCTLDAAHPSHAHSTQHIPRMRRSTSLACVGLDQVAGVEDWLCGHLGSSRGVAAAHAHSTQRMRTRRSTSLACVGLDQVKGVEYGCAGI